MPFLDGSSGSTAAISLAQVEQLEACLDAASVKTLLADIFHLGRLNIDNVDCEGEDSVQQEEQQQRKKATIAVDFYFYAYAYCKERAFSNRQTCCLLSILKHVFDSDMTGSPKRTLTQSYELFTQILLKHSVERPPSSVKVFERDQVVHVLDYVVNSYYRHFRLYKYIFSVKVVHSFEQVLPQLVEICRPNLPPLDSALLLESA